MNLVYLKQKLILGEDRLIFFFNFCCMDITRETPYAGYVRASHWCGIGFVVIHAIVVINSE